MICLSLPVVSSHTHQTLLGNHALPLDVFIILLSESINNCSLIMPAPATRTDFCSTESVSYPESMFAEPMSMGAFRFLQETALGFITRQGALVLAPPAGSTHVFRNTDRVVVFAGKQEESDGLEFAH